MGSLFPRFTQEFSPLFRLLDDYDRASRQQWTNFSSELRSFQPKFDVKELKDISIEWTDGNTLAIKGRTEKRVERGTRPNAAEVIEEAPKASGAIQAAPDAETSSTTSENYHKPTVSDEGEDSASTVAGDHNALTPATTNAGEVAKPAENQEPEPKFWVSERSVGEFHRSFTFPLRVNHDAVKASLKNGILSIIVPKAQTPKARKIEI